MVKSVTGFVPVRPGRVGCPCGNTARFGATLCGRCQDSYDRADRATELTDAVRHASYDIPDGPMRRFADAVVAWIEGNGK